METRGRKKGCKKTGGRKPGQKNRFTTSIKDAFKEAFQRMGSADGLYHWAKDNPTEFYRLIARLIPNEVEMSGKDGGPIPCTLIQVVEAGANVSTAEDSGETTSSE